MVKSQNQARDTRKGKVDGINSHSLKPNEQALVGDQRATIPLAQLVDTEDAARERQQHGEAEESQEGVHAAAEPAAGAGEADQVVAEEAAEEHEGKDLEGEAREREVDARLARAGGARRHGAAGGLEGQGDEVAGDEDPVEELGGKACEGWGYVVDPALKC